MNASDS
jgi:putative transposase